MAIKKLQNNYTTPEQSKRLLELGVPVDSADCFYDTMKNNPFEGTPQVRSDSFGNNADFFEDWHFWAGSPIEKVVPSHRTPCWSAGRLMEINRMCNTASGQWNLYSNNDTRTLVEWMMDVFENSQYDFSKLEED